MKFVGAFGLSLSCIAGLAGSLEAGDGTLGAGVQVGVVETGHDMVFEDVASFREVVVSVDSGIVRVEADEAIDGERGLQVPIWSQVVEIDDSDWVRLRLSDVVLAKSTQEVRESYIRVSSLEDGYEQYLDIDTIEEWSNTSAYFNGSAVLVELMASPNVSDQVNRIVINGVQASDPVSERSICFSVDDRALSSDPRDARLMPMGCSAWLFGDQGSCFLTAGHCGVSGSSVVQFNVPLSSGGGSTRNPPPQDQYVVDSSSVQTTTSVFIGNDWSFFGTFDNSTTGLSPMQAMGDSHTLATSVGSNDGRPIRITGYGTVSSPVPGSWNQVQKTHVGPLASISGTIIRYQTDTSGGNSGSAIVDENADKTLGIHTNAGCGSGGGSNQGTSIMNSGLQVALANPRGICLPRNIQASLLFEPTHVSPAGGDVVTLLIDNLQGHSVVGTPTMFVDYGAGFVSSSMSSAGADSYEGSFSAIACGTALSYYFSIEDEEGTITNVPEIGSLSTVALDGLTVAFEDDFELNTGWLSFTSGGSGSWIRTTPVGYGFGDPESDADGSGRCFVTGGSNGVDVDNGSVFIMSPVVDLTAIESPVMRMSVWMTGSVGDALRVSVTDNAGVSWTQIDSFVNTNGWIEVEYNLEDFVSLNLAFRARIEAMDGGANTTVEGGVDAFRIANEVCNNSCSADLNGDGSLDFFDVSAFLAAFSAQEPAGDFNGDGEYNFFDVSDFLGAFSAGCP